MESVAVISSVYEVQQYTSVKTGTDIGQGFRTLYVRYGGLSYSIMAVQVSLNAGCPWKRWPSLPCVLPAALQGCWQAGAWRGAGGKLVWPCRFIPACARATGTRRQHDLPADNCPCSASLESEGETTALLLSLSIRRPPSSTDGEVSCWVRKSLLFTSYQAGTFFSVSLTVRL